MCTCAHGVERGWGAGKGKGGGGDNMLVYALLAELSGMCLYHGSNLLNCVKISRIQFPKLTFLILQCIKQQTQDVKMD